MSIKRCYTKGKPVVKWGNEGKCFTYTPGDEKGKDRAKKKAVDQGVKEGDLEALKEKVKQL